jgi:RAB protein geranylgeranyltransferase component A
MYPLGSGIAIDCLIQSGVANYLEFKSLDRISYLSSSSRIESVPCSKGDVFNTKLLNALEKRVLMKFLQFVSDWGQTNTGSDVTTVNERELSQGRSLQRPQNKENNTSSYNVEEYLNKPFHLFLSNCKLSIKLQSIVSHALCLNTSGSYLNNDKNIANSSNESNDIIDTKTSLLQLYSHYKSIGKYGETAFLCPIYGFGELPQSFCRMCAVWGGTYILRRGIKHLIIDNKDDSINDEKINENKLIDSNSDCNNDGNNDSNNNNSLSIHSIEDTTGKIFTCNNVVCHIEDLATISEINSCSITLTAICDCNVLPDSRTMLVMPPHIDTINNNNAIYVIQSDSDTFVTPQGYSLLHIITKENVNENIISRNNWNNFSTSSDCIQYGTNMKNVIKLLQSIYKFELLSYSTVIRPIFVSNESNNTPKKPSLLNNLPSSIGISGETSLDIHIDNAVNQAKDIFNNLFPNDLFFPVLDVEDGADKEDMQEADYLNSTLNDYSQTTTTNTTNDNDEDNDDDEDNEISSKVIDIIIE